MNEINITIPEVDLHDIRWYISDNNKEVLSGLVNYEDNRITLNFSDADPSVFYKIIMKLHDGSVVKQFNLPDPIDTTLGSAVVRLNYQIISIGSSSSIRLDVTHEEMDPMIFNPVFGSYSLGSVPSKLGYPNYSPLPLTYVRRPTSDWDAQVVFDGYLRSGHKLVTPFIKVPKGDNRTVGLYSYSTDGKKWYHISTNQLTLRSNQSKLISILGDEYTLFKS